MTNDIRNIWKKYNIGLYGAIFGSLIMGTFHLVLLIIDFSWLTFNYMLFCYMIMFIRVLIWYIAKKNTKYLYLISAISVLFLLIPLCVSLVKTITDRDVPVYIFEWIIYGYATYGTYKMVSAIVRLVKSKKCSNDEKTILSWISLISALFTMFMMQFALSKTFGTVEDNDAMYVLLLVTQGAILLFSTFVIGLFIKKFILQIKNKKEVE